MALGRVTQQESAEDVYFGQVVILHARYFLILGLLAVVLTALQDSAQMVMAVVPAVLFLAMNFFLHARYLMGQPANLRLIVLTSAVDLVLVTWIVVVGPGRTGVDSPFFVLYYPLVLAFAFVVTRRIEIVYTGAAMVLLAAAVLVRDPSTLADLLAMKALVLRLITLAACGGIANYYWRTLRTRRRSGAHVPAAL
jgi:hypothetical protein